MKTRNTLLTMEFVSICLLVFLTYCNLTVFYNLYLYLEQIGIAANWRGFLIGSSALATIIFFLFATPYMRADNAARWASVGLLMLIGCGFSYLHARSVPSLLAVRLAHGAAVYLLSASSMTLLTENIPTERSGQAFSLYSIALLLPYSIVPAAFDAISPGMASIAVGYRDMSLFLVPALGMVFLIDRRRKRRPAPAQAAPTISIRDMYRNAAKPPIFMVMLINALYIMAFTSLFYLAKGLFLSRGHSSLGYYFTIQTCCMMGIRLCGNNIFDSVPKVRLIRISFFLSAVSFVLAAGAQSLLGLYGSSFLMGLGMGLSSPALYGLMFTLSDPDYKAVNSNLMLLSVQIGNFMGPLLGAWVMQRVGYDGFLISAAAVCIMNVALCSLLTRRMAASEGQTAGA